MVKSASKARIFLFHGNDSLMSRRSLQHWERAFVDKHADVSHHRIFADVGTVESVQESLQQIVQEQSLFAMPTLYVIYRPTAQEKGKRGAYSEVLLSVCSQLVKQARTDSTILIWEEKRLSADHSVTKWFAEHEQAGTAKSYEFSVPPVQELLREGAEYCDTLGITLDSTAQRLLQTYLIEMDKAQRAAAKLRSTDVVALDMRRSWLWNVLDTCSLAVRGGVIRAVDIERCVDPIQAEATPFEVANALERVQWQRARTLLYSWSEDSDMGPYFVLLGVLRQRYRNQLPHTSAQYALDLLAEMELLTKNGLAKMAWLFDVFTIRMEHVESGQPLVSPRVVWLAVQ